MPSHENTVRALRPLLILVALVSILWAWLANSGYLGAFDISGMYLFRQGPDYAAAIGPQWLTTAMTVVTHIGGSATLIVVSLLLIAFAWRKYGRQAAMAYAVPLAGVFAIVPLFKFLFARARPEIVEHLVHVSSQSFPSGHALRSAVVYSIVALVICRTNVVRPGLIMAAFGALILAVGVSRVFLGVHWPSDIVGAWLFALVWLLVCVPLLARAGN